MKEDMPMDERVSGELVAVGERLERWRKRSGGRGSRIPGDLWNEAATVARVQGVYATARALRLNYDGLKARVAAAEAGGASMRAGAGFVELQMGPPPSTAGAVVELADARGGQMRIHIRGVRTTELVALAEAFWNRQS